MRVPTYLVMPPFIQRLKMEKKVYLDAYAEGLEAFKRLSGRFADDPGRLEAIGGRRALVIVEHKDGRNELLG